MIAKTRTDFIFAMIKAIPIIIVITSNNSNKSNISNTKTKLSLLERGEHGKLNNFPKQNFLTGLSHQVRSGHRLTKHLNVSKLFRSKAVQLF